MNTRQGIREKQSQYVDKAREDLQPRKLAKSMTTFDPDLPGGGRYFCPETSRHFETAEALETHKKTKAFKKRLKELKEEPYTHEEAMMAGGMGPIDNGQPFGRGAVGAPPPATVEEALKELKQEKKKEKKRQKLLEKASTSKGIKKKRAKKNITKAGAALKPMQATDVEMGVPTNN
uniref:C2H2-type domain-containing protein n=1 Tax=Palpitomonas bilix TaxID=652834 RepID=A0A7S3GBK9_9EUKA